MVDVVEAALHPRVLELDEPDGRSLALVCWSDPGGVHAMHRALAKHIEASLLAELSRPASRLQSERSPLRFLRLLVLEPVPGNLADAVRAFGLNAVPPKGAAWRRALSHMRHEANVVGRLVPDEPASAWEADVLLPTERDALLRRVEEILSASTGNERWGEQPGAPAERLSAALHHCGQEALEPTLACLDDLERLLVGTQPGSIRWILPLTFQALCDFVAVVAHVAFDAPIAWAVAEDDDESLASPPLVRVRDTYLPIGAHVLRWCVMPLQQGEVVPPLGEWLAAELTSSSDRPA